MGTCALLECLGHGLNDLITGEMPMEVIDLLEVIDVHGDQADATEAVLVDLQPMAVQEARQAVRHGLGFYGFSTGVNRAADSIGIVQSCIGQLKQIESELV